MIGHVTVADIREAAKAAKSKVWESAAEYDREPKIYLHWTGGHYNQTSNSYHVNIKGNGDIWQTRNFYETTDGTWRRNSGAINLTLCGCFDATSNNLGSEPPTADQIEEMAKVIAAVAEGLGIPIDKQHVMTHGEAADNEDGIEPHEAYGPLNGCERWDLEYLGTPESPRYNPRATDGTRGGDVLRGKANWYLNGGENVPKEEQKVERYNTIDDVPEWGKEAVKNSIRRGILKGTGDGLDIDAKDLRYIVWLDRGLTWLNSMV